MTSGSKALNLGPEWIYLEIDYGKRFPSETLALSSLPFTFPNSVLLAEDPQMIGNSCLFGFLLYVSP